MSNITHVYAINVKYDYFKDEETQSNKEFFRFLMLSFSV
jgi:hypothetical protein